MDALTCIGCLQWLLAYQKQNKIWVGLEMEWKYWLAGGVWSAALTSRELCEA